MSRRISNEVVSVEYTREDSRYMSNVVVSVEYAPLIRTDVATIGIMYEVAESKEGRNMLPLLGVN